MSIMVSRKGRASFQNCLVTPSSKTQGQSDRLGEMARRKFSSTGGRAPGTDSNRTISKRSSECWILIGHKKYFVLLCPIGEQFLLSYFREFLHDGYYLASVARFVHQAFLTRQSNNRWVEKRFGCYQQEQFNLHWENSVSDGSQCILSNRKFKMRRRRTRNQKSNSLTRKNNNFALASRFILLYISLPSLQDYRVKIPSFTFCDWRNHAMSDRIFFLFINLDIVDRNSAPEELACI